MDVTETDMKESEDKEEEDGAVGEEETPLSPAAALSLPHVCGEGLATRIHRVIVRNIIPQLHACLTQKVSSVLGCLLGFVCE